MISIVLIIILINVQFGILTSSHKAVPAAYNRNNDDVLVKSWPHLSNNEDSSKDNKLNSENPQHLTKRYKRDANSDEIVTSIYNGLDEENDLTILIFIFLIICFMLVFYYIYLCIFQHS
ncbi:hypothetical protein ACKWTF_013990 [Chironomus riparius]